MKSRVLDDSIFGLKFAFAINRLQIIAPQMANLIINLNKLKTDVML